MSSNKLSFGFFIALLGYHREIRGGKRVVVKKIDRNRESIVDEEQIYEEYKTVCDKLSEIRGG